MISMVTEATRIRGDSPLTAFAAARIEAIGEPQPARICPFCGRRPQLTMLTSAPVMPGIAPGAPKAAAVS